MFEKLSAEKRAEVEAQQQSLLDDFHRRMAEADPPKSAIEIAREYGVDIEQLRWLHTLTPAQRLSYSESMLEFALALRASAESKKERYKHDRSAQI